MAFLPPPPLLSTKTRRRPRPHSLIVPKTFLWEPCPCLLSTTSPQNSQQHHNTTPNANSTTSNTKSSRPPLLLTKRVYAWKIDKSRARPPDILSDKASENIGEYADDEDDDVGVAQGNGNGGEYGYGIGKKRVMDILQGHEGHLSWWVRGGGWMFMKRRRVGDPPWRFLEMGFGWVVRKKAVDRVRRSSKWERVVVGNMGGDRARVKGRRNGNGNGGWDHDIRDVAEPRIRSRGGLKFWYQRARKWNLVDQERLTTLRKKKNKLVLDEERVRDTKFIKNLRYKGNKGKWFPYHADDEDVVPKVLQLSLDNPLNGNDNFDNVFHSVTDEEGMMEAEIHDDVNGLTADEDGFSDSEEYAQSPTQTYLRMLEQRTLKKMLEEQDVSEDEETLGDTSSDEDEDQILSISDDTEEEYPELVLNSTAESSRAASENSDTPTKFNTEANRRSEPGKILSKPASNIRREPSSPEEIRLMNKAQHEERVKKWFVNEPLLMQNIWNRAIGRRPRVIVIGDVHGCIKELSQLLRLADFRPGDQVIFLGDLVAKGPNSVAVVKLAREIGAKSVRGNHDHEVVRWGETKRLGTMQDVPAYPNSEHAQIAAALGPREHKWLLQCPWFITIPGLEYVFVHAGFIPGMRLTQQNPRLMMNMRSVLDNGSVTSRNVEDCAWGRSWPGPETVVFGHDALRGLQRYKYALGIDTGCVYGGRLTALLLPDNRLISVGAERAYVVPRRRRGY